MPEFTCGCRRTTRQWRQAECRGDKGASAMFVEAVALLQRVQARSAALRCRGDGTGRRRQRCGSELPGQMAGGGARGKVALCMLAGVEQDARKQPRLGRKRAG